MEISYGGTVFTNDLQYPAKEYFPEGDKNSRYYHVVKLARTESNEVLIPYSTGNPKGWAYGVDNNQNVCQPENQGFVSSI